MFHIRCTKLQGVTIGAILSKRRYVNICTIIYNYILMHVHDFNSVFYSTDALSYPTKKTEVTYQVTSLSRTPCI